MRSQDKKKASSIRPPTSFRTNTSNIPKSTSSHFKEEPIEIKIPTPYPQAKYMTINSPSLQNSPYTSILNHKYPPRKYLNHNAISFNKTNRQKNQNIKFTLLNPQINFSDYNLKSVTYKNEEIDTSKITSLTDAHEIINSLKAKLIEFQLANKSNISKSNDLVNKLKEQNEFLINQLNDVYLQLENIETTYGIDTDVHNPNDPVNTLVTSFRNKWLKIKFMNMLSERTCRQKRIKYNYYNNILPRKEYILKLKAFIGFEKLQNTCDFKKTLAIRRADFTKRNILISLKRNVIYNNIYRKFKEFQRNLHLLLYMKELKIKTIQSINYKDLNQKGLWFYYENVAKKIMKVFKANVFHNHKKVNEKGEVGLRKGNNLNYLNFTKALSAKYKNKLTPEMKEMKIKALRKLKEFYNRIDLNNKNKLVYNKNANRNIILSNYFKLWLIGSNENSKTIHVNIQLKNNILKNIFKNLKQNYMQRKYKTITHNPKVRNAYIKLFFSSIKKTLTLRNNKALFIQKKPTIIRKAILNKMLILSHNDPLVKVINLQKSNAYKSFLSKLKFVLALHKHMDVIKHNNKIFQTKTFPYLQHKLFMLICQKKILKNNIQYNRINSFITKHYKRKYIHTMLNIKRYKKENSLRAYYENTIMQIKRILNEKTGIINKLEYDNNDLCYNYEQVIAKLQALTNENEILKQNLCEIKYNYSNEKKQYDEMLKQKIKDVHSLQARVKNNEDLLSEAIIREEKLQKKYCNDIQTAINLNKNLNDIINRKNQQILDIKEVNGRENKEMMKEQQKLKYQNAMLYCDISSVIHAKEREKDLMRIENEKKNAEIKIMREKFQKEQEDTGNKLMNNVFKELI